ncbi:hypothetical protein DBR06_SOUSAS33210015, partial [Sousa chinensis]
IPMGFVETSVLRSSVVLTFDPVKRSTEVKSAK